MPVIRIDNLSPAPLRATRRIVVESIVYDPRPRIVEARIESLRPVEDPARFEPRTAMLTLVPARRISDDLYEADVEIYDVPALSRIVIERPDLNAPQISEPHIAQVEANFAFVKLPLDPGTHFGGPLQARLKLAGDGFTSDLFSMEPVSVERVGTSVECTVVGVAGDQPDYAVRGWLRWYPMTPGIVEAEFAITRRTETAFAPRKLRLEWGGAIVAILGEQQPEEGIDCTLGQHQSRVLVRVVFVFPQHVLDPLHAASAFAIARLLVNGHGVEKLHRFGSPSIGMPDQMITAGAVAVRSAIVQGRAVRLPIGPSPRSGDTGDQEDQFFQPGASCVSNPSSTEMLLRPAVAAHTLGLRPSNYVTETGELIDLGVAPFEGGIWDGRPFNSEPVKRALGVTRDQTVADTAGYQGPDTQHWLVQSLNAALRFTASPALQHLLGQQAMLYLAQRTTQRGWGTSAKFSSRELGYEAVLVDTIDRCLADRTLAGRVMSRYGERMKLFADAFLAMTPEQRRYLHLHRNDPRLGAGDWAITWQDSLGAYGLWLGSTLRGVSIDDSRRIRGIAVSIAERIVREDIHGDLSAVIVERALDGRVKVFDPSFIAWGYPMAACVVVKESADAGLVAKAKAYLLRLYQLNDPKALRWMPPEMAREQLEAHFYNAEPTGGVQ